MKATHRDENSHIFGQHIDPPDKLIQSQVKKPAHTRPVTVPQAMKATLHTPDRSTPPLCVLIPGTGSLVPEDLIVSVVSPGGARL